MKWLNQQKYVFSISAGWKSKIIVSAELVSLEVFLFVADCHLTIFTWVFLCVHILGVFLYPNFLLLYTHPSHCISAHSICLSFNFATCLKVAHLNTAHSKIFQVWTSNYEFGRMFILVPNRWYLNSLSPR